MQQQALELITLKNSSSRIPLDSIDPIKFKDEDDNTSLHYAAQEGLEELVSWLLDQGAKMSFNSDGFTPIHIATKNNRENIVKLLVGRYPACINLQVSEGNSYGLYTPLHFASESGACTNIVKFLLSSSMIEVNAQDETGRTPLHCCCAKGISKHIKLLINSGSEPDLCDKQKRTPLCLAAQAGKVETVKILLDTAMVNVDHVDSNHDTILHHAAEVLVQRLIFNYNWSMKSHHLQIFYSLLLYGADPYLKNDEGDNPLDIIEESLADIFEYVHKYNKVLFEYVPRFSDLLTKSRTTLVDKYRFSEVDADRYMLAKAEYEKNPLPEQGTLYSITLFIRLSNDVCKM
eukprot:TRINITY_DN1732_c0_g1_i3.p1 TRINITY_DN1732_c0_g1~~TRINITY_DN1732_c0_g1_i3.p1  ORF type:complete len:346 (+),score=49.23 TRINITY_DN1732_c0_g1_i3:549-1586(+)